MVGNEAGESLRSRYWGHRPDAVRSDVKSRADGASSGADIVTSTGFIQQALELMYGSGVRGRARGFLQWGHIFEK